MAAGTINLPGLFSIDHNLTIVGGNVSADCPVGSSCDNLPGTGDGLLLRTVHTAGGKDFIQSIIAENVAGGGLFANEQNVQQGVQGAQNAANITQKMVIEDPLEGFSATHTVVDSLPGQNLNGLPIFELNQTVDLGAGAFSKVRIRGAITTSLFDGAALFGTVNHGVEEITNNPYFGPGVREQLGGLAVYIDQIGGASNPEMGDFVYRYDRTELSNENQTLSNGLGSVNTGVYNPPGCFGPSCPGGSSTFQTNRDAVVYMHQSVTGMNNDFGYLKFGAGIYDFVPQDHLGVWSPTWTPTLVSLDGLPSNVSSTVQVGLDPTDAYGAWGAGSVAESVFGALNDTSDFNLQTFMP